MPRRPVIALTCDLWLDHATPPRPWTRLRSSYADRVAQAGGVALLLPPPLELPEAALDDLAHALLDTCDAIVFTGGADPDTRRYAQPLHPSADLVHPARQRFEEALLRALDHQPHVPALGVCLGAQMMALHAGGQLNQHLQDDTPTHSQHGSGADTQHPIQPCEPTPHRAPLRLTLGTVTSHHHQAVRDPGRLRVIARASDGVIEAIDDPARRFFAGVQWHPERTDDPALGLDIFRQLVSAAQARSPHS